MTPRPSSWHALTDISLIRDPEAAPGQITTKYRWPLYEDATLRRPFHFLADAGAIASVRELTETARRAESIGIDTLVIAADCRSRRRSCCSADECMAQRMQ